MTYDEAFAVARKQTVAAFSRWIGEQIERLEAERGMSPEQALEAFYAEEDADEMNLWMAKTVLAAARVYMDPRAPTTLQ